MGDIHIGISGWRYPPWRGAFYPKGLPQRLELEFASRALPSIEINGSFYALQSPKSYRRWYEDTPAGFVFSVKANRYITHVLRLQEIETPLANFFASGLFHLQEKLGPILWQFPPSFRYEPKQVEHFFRLLPPTTSEALSLATHRDSSMEGRVCLAIDKDRPLRHCMEVRHESFVNESFVALLRKYRIALVVADTAGKWPYKEDLTADFVYLRLHGDEVLYVSGYTDKALARWADRIRLWSKGSEPTDAHHISSEPPQPRPSRDVYCYFDNDVKVMAPFDARTLMGKLGLGLDLPPLPPFVTNPRVEAEEPRTLWPVIKSSRQKLKQHGHKTPMPD